MFSSQLDLASPDATTDVMSRRSARVAFGGVLLAGSVAMFVNAICGTPVHFATLIVAIWLCAFGAAVVARWCGVLIVERSAGLTLALPSAGIVMMGPLTLHLLAVPAALVSRSPGVVSGFDFWTLCSLALVGHVHIVSAILVARRGFRLADPTRQPQSVVKIYLIAIALSLFPGVILFAIPPVVVALTGALLLPALTAMDRIAKRERDPEPPTLALAVVRSGAH